MLVMMAEDGRELSVAAGSGTAVGCETDVASLVGVDAKVGNGLGRFDVGLGLGNCVAAGSDTHPRRTIEAIRIIPMRLSLMVVIPWLMDMETVSLEYID